MIVGKKLKFLPRRFISPPREFRFLYGREVRQTTIDSFFVVKKK